MNGEAATFADLLRTFRIRLELTQEDLAERAGLSPDAIGLLERGERRRPHANTLARLVAALELSAAERAQFEAVARRPAPLVAQAPQQFPPTPNPLVGRAKVIASIAALFDQPAVRLVTLTGPGGVGKTRLALAVAEQLAHAFADGVAFVSLAPVRTPDLVLEEIAAALGVHERAGQTPQQRLIQTLQSRQMLLVLDNFEHLLPAAVLVSTIVAACRQIVVLATSRAPLRLAGEHQFAVAPLELPATCQEVPLEHLVELPAVALFQQRAQAVAPGFTVTTANGEAVLAICRRLDGLPLAIELAAAWIKLLPPQLLLQQLERRLPLLVGGPRDLPARQRTMHDTIAWSYAFLSVPAQGLLRRLAVCVGGFTLPAAEAIGDGGEESGGVVLSNLAELVDASLIHLGADVPQAWETHATAHYRMLETVREFAMERLAASGQQAAVQRQHAGYYVVLAEQAETALTGAQQAEWLARLALEHANLRAALAWAVESGAARVGLRLAGALWRFWYMGGHLSEGRHWLGAAIALPSAAGENVRALRGKALFGASGLAWGQGDFAEAVALGKRSLLIQREVGDTVGTALVLNVLANVAKDRGDHVQARAYLEEGLHLQRAAGHQFGIVTALMNLGVLARDQGDYPRALALYEESLVLYRALGNTAGTAIALNNLGDALLTAGDYVRAATLFEESAALARAINNPREVATALDNLGIAVRYGGDYVRASVLAEESLAIRQQLGDKESLVTSLANLGEIALEQGDDRRARTWLDQSLALAREVGKLEWVALVQRNLGRVALNAGAHSEAARRLGESLRLYEASGMLIGVAEVLESCAALALAQARAPRAVRLLSAAAALRVKRGARATPPERRLSGQTNAATYTQLDAAAFAAAWATGQAMTLEQAVAYAATASDGCDA